MATNTAFDAADPGTMLGDSGWGWRLTNLDGLSSTRDAIGDPTGSEVVSDTDCWW